jgi:hypothetical protein
MSAIHRNKPKTTPINPTKPLCVAKREIFAQYVARGVSVREAYRLAGYVGKDPSSITGIRRAPDIDARVGYLLEQRIKDDTRARHRREKPIADARLRVVKELERVAFADIRDIMQWERRPVVGATGNVIGFEDVVIPLPSRLLSADAVAAVRGVTAKSGALKIELTDKLQALDKLARMLGLFQEPAPATNVTVNQVNLDNGPGTALEAVKRLAFAIAKVQHQHAKVAASQPAIIENEKTETTSPEQQA